MSLAASGLQQHISVNDEDSLQLEKLAVQVDTTAGQSVVCTSSQLHTGSNSKNSICVAAFSTEDGCLWGSPDATLHSVMDNRLQAKRSMIAIPMQHTEKQTDCQISVLAAQHILQTAAKVLCKT